MIAAGEWFIDGGFAFGEQPGKKDRALHLGTGYGRPVVNPTQRTAANAQRRRLLRSLRDDVGPHFAQWFDHAIHRALGQ